MKQVHVVLFNYNHFACEAKSHLEAARIVCDHAARHGFGSIPFFAVFDPDGDVSFGHVTEGEGPEISETVHQGSKISREVRVLVEGQVLETHNGVRADTLGHAAAQVLGSVSRKTQRARVESHSGAWAADVFCLFG